MSVENLVSSGPLILAIPVAAAAGALTFLSPCCLPLVPGYLSYITGMSGVGAAEGAAVTGGGTAAVAVAEGSGGVTTATVTTSDAPGSAPTGRAVAGTALFVLGFSAVFAVYGLAFGGLGHLLRAHNTGLTQVLGDRKSVV